MLRRSAYSDPKISSPFIYLDIKGSIYSWSKYSGDRISLYEFVERVSLKRSFKVIGLSEFKKNLVLELESDQEFNFFVHDLMRSFDRFRKTLDNEGIKKDLLIFNQLSEKELMYYQIWGYPYYFECGKHHIS